MPAIASTLLSMFFAFLALSLAIHFVRVTFAQNKAGPRARHALISNRSGMLLSNGMIRTKRGQRGVTADKKLSDNFLDSVY